MLDTLSVFNLLNVVNASAPKFFFLIFFRSVAVDLLVCYWHVLASVACLGCQLDEVCSLR